MSAEILDQSPRPSDKNYLDELDAIQQEKKRSFGFTVKTKIQLTFKNVVIQTTANQRRFYDRRTDIPDSKVIIDNISGTVLPGQFVAILGASGAGKTTLLNYLSGRQISRNLRKDGQVLINGVDSQQIKGGVSTICAYVQQDDVLFQTLTVRESIEFAAKLKLRGTYEEKMRTVDRIIDELGLRKCQNTWVGGPLFKGVSGGERKRASIAVELITDPSLIFLDEPTTGLDSFTATSVMQTLRTLARSGRTIITTIHQPNTDIYESFDRLLLMARGKIVYFNEAKFAVDYFASLGPKYKCPEWCNPADFFMDLLSIENIEVADSMMGSQIVRTHDELVAQYAESINFLSQNYENSRLKNNYAYSSPDVGPIDEREFKKNSASWFEQFRLITIRNFVVYMRIPQTSILKFLVVIMVGILVSVMFHGLDGTLMGVRNRNGVLFFVVTAIGFISMQFTMLVFPYERPIFLREVNSNMYNVSPYFFGRFAAELPYCFLLPAIFGTIIYFAVGLDTSVKWKYPLNIGILIISYNASASLALVVSAIFKERQKVITITPLFMLISQLFAGFIVSLDQIPVWLRWLQYLSFYKYGYQAVMLTEYEGLDLECMHYELLKCDPLGDFNSPQNIQVSILALSIMFVGLTALACIILKAVSKSYD